MDKKKTNIFCIIANIGSDQEQYIRNILSDILFIKATNLSRLIYNTTKPADLSEKKNKKYNHYSVSEYDKIPKEEIIEERSYYNVIYKDVFYFTKVSDIENKGNIIAIVSPFQYENYKRWVSNENIRTPDKYGLYAIIINRNHKVSIIHALDEIDGNDEVQILELCRRVMGESFEFNNVSERLPEFKDPLNCSNVCYINYNKNTDEVFKSNLSSMKKFIQQKIKV